MPICTIGYMLEADPDKRPTIWQVTEVVCRMLGRPNTLPNVFVSERAYIFVCHSWVW